MAVALLFALVGCGGGPGGAAPVQPATEVRFASGTLSLALDVAGYVVDVRVGGDSRAFAAADPQPLLEVVREGETLLPDRARAVPGGVELEFDGGAASIRLDVEAADGRIVFRVAEVVPSDAEAVRLRLAVQRLDEVDPSLNGTYDDDVVLCLRSIEPATRCIYRSLPGGIPQPGVEWDAVHGIVGGAAAWIAAPRSSFFSAVHALQVAEQLPAPRFDGVPARASRSMRQSYLFLTYLQPGTATRVIEYANLAGLSRVLLLRTLWRRSAGTYGLDPVRWPGGLSDLASFCSQLRGAGLGVGLHVFGPSISLDDPLVTPVPAPGLLAWPCPALAADVDAAAGTLTLVDAATLPPSGGGRFPGRYLRLGDEIVRYGSTEAGPPFQLTGCERGALGTIAATHAAGAVPWHLATVNDQLLVDPDGPLVATLAANLAAVVNGAGIDMIYFDGTAAMPTNDFVQRWYYMNRTLPPIYAAFDHDVLVQTGMGPGREMDWHIVPRSASADGHGDIKWYLDRRTPSIESILRGLTVPDIGWYGFGAGRPPDHLEYVCAKALGWDAGISLQTNVIELEGDRRAREVLEMIGRYERWKSTGGPPPAVRDALLVPGRDFHLVEDADGSPHLFEASYDEVRDVRSLQDGASGWNVSSSAGGDRLLGVEITRGEAVRSHADFTAAGAITLDPLGDAAPFAPGGANDSARLVNRTESTMNAAGPARTGVQHTFVAVPDAAVGGQALELAATNTNTSIGWCAVGRRFAPVVDLTGQAATGLWVHGDGSGIELSIELYDNSDDRLVLKVPLFFQGWRLFTFPLTPPAAFDRTRCTYMVIVADDLPPESAVTLRLALLRATPAVVAPADITGVSLEVGGRSIAIPQDLAPGCTARIDALGRLTIWPGGMAAGSTTPVPGGPLVVSPGVTPVALRVTGPAAYPGDIAVRTSRLVPLFP